MNTVLDTIEKGTAYLEAKGVEDARRNMQLLVTHHLGCSKVELYMQFDRPMAESDLAILRDRMKAEGRRYTWQINTNARNSGYPVSYWADFDTPDSEWAYVDIPFSDFIPNFRGFKLDGPPLDPGDITEFGLYIYDKKDGPFELHMDRIEAY